MSEATLHHLDLRGDRTRTMASAALHALPQAIAVLDRTGTVLVTNRSWDRERTRSPWASLASAIAEGDDFVEDCRDAAGTLSPAGDHVADGVLRVLEGRVDRFEIQYLVDVDAEDDDSGRCYLLTATALDPSQGDAHDGGDCVIVTHQDTTVHHRVREVFTEMAFQDPLTGLPNRSLVLDRLRVVLRRTQRSSSSSLSSKARAAVIFIDLDGFKAINDDLGHAAGDQVLQEIGRRLSRAIRRHDTCGRWGGDEFVLVVELDDAAALADIIERTLATTNQPIPLAGGGATVGMSIGVALTDGAAGADQLLRLADQAMYEAKRAGVRVRVSATP